MHPRTTPLLWPAAALSLLAGCLLDVTPEPEPEPPPPPPPGVVTDLQGQLVGAAGTPVPFIPVRLGGPGGAVVPSDGTGTFTFPDVAPGQHTVYAYDRFERRVGFATIDFPADCESHIPTIALHSCDEVLFEWDIDPVVLDLCDQIDVIDLPPATPAANLDDINLSLGVGYTNPYNTAAYSEGSSLPFLPPLEVFFSVHDGFGAGGVREYVIEDHAMVGGDPGYDPFEDPSFAITIQDANGHQLYVVRDGVIRLELAPGDGPTRAYILTGTSLVLDYSPTYDVFDPAHTLTVPSVRLEGTLDVELPPAAPEGNVTAQVSGDPAFADYSEGREHLRLSLFGGNQAIVALALETAQLALPGTVTVELPVGDVPNLEGSVASVPSADGLSRWDFQLISYTVTTEMSELPGCDEQVTLTLEDLVFRYVSWEYDENSDRVDSFGDQLLTIDRVDVDALIIPTPGGC